MVTSVIPYPEIVVGLLVMEDQAGVIVVLPAAVMRPLALTVKVDAAVAEPKDPTLEFTVASVPAAVTFADPSKDGEVQVKSPVMASVRPVDRASDLYAVPLSIRHLDDVPSYTKATDWFGPRVRSAPKKNLLALFDDAFWFAKMISMAPTFCKTTILPEVPAVRPVIVLVAVVAVSRKTVDVAKLVGA